MDPRAQTASQSKNYQIIALDLPGHGESDKPVSEAAYGAEMELRAINVPVEIIVGDRDPTKRLYVTPLQQVRKDWPVIEIKDAGHLNCIVKPQFKEAIAEWLSKDRL